MRSFSVKTLLIILLGLLVTGTPALAAEDDEYALQKKSYDVLNDARELMQEESWSEAIAKIRSLLAEDPGNYDQAVAYQTIGYAYISMNDYGAAIENFTHSLDGDHLPADVSHNIRYTLAQLLIHQARYEDGVKYLEMWLQNEPEPDKQAYMLAASAYYQLENYEQMIPLVQKAMAKTTSPDQSLYELLLAGYFNTGRFGEAAAALEKMIKYFPEKDSYWLQLAGTYHRLENYKKALAIYEIAHARGILDEDRLLQLARLYINQSLPYKAGKLLQQKMESGVIKKNIDNLELLSNSWMMAREYDRAIEAFKQLAAQKNDPQLYYRIGRISFEQENWQEAVNALDRAVKADMKSNIAESWLLLGIAAFKINRDSLSSNALTKASGFDSTKEQARWWLNKLEKKKQEQVGSS